MAVAETAAEAEDGFSLLSGDELHYLLSLLPAQALACFACTSKAHRAAASDERLWSRLLQNDWTTQVADGSARRTFSELQDEFGGRRRRRPRHML